jgi:hypothetical protein
MGFLIGRRDGTTIAGMLGMIGGEEDGGILLAN